LDGGRNARACWLNANQNDVVHKSRIGLKPSEDGRWQLSEAAHHRHRFSSCNSAASPASELSAEQGG
jgi:hypothetical protein